MKTICDSRENEVAYIVDQLIISSNDDKLLGVILGHCVFGIHSELIGIYFKEKIRNKKGEIIATLKYDSNNHHQIVNNRNNFITQGWSIIDKIKEHFCSFIEEKPVWSKVPITEALLA